MDEQLLGVFRRPAELVALVSCRPEAFAHPRPSLDEPASSLAEVDPYQEDVLLLQDCGRAQHKVWTELRTSWDLLGRVSVFDEQTLFHVLHVLTHTLPESEAANIPPLNLESAPPVRVPTARHPRAFRGTKHQPPKRKHSAPVDLRPHLCVAGDVNRLLRHLAPYLPSAQTLLQHADLAPEKFTDLVDADNRVVDPYLHYCHAAGGQSVHALPARFRTHLLFWLRGQPWDAVGAALALYWGLGLETDGPLLRCLSRFLAKWPAPSALAWGQFLLRQPAGRRTALAELLVEAHVQGDAPSARLAEVIREVDLVSTDSAYRHRMLTILKFFRSSNDLDYLQDGIHLAQKYQPEYEFRDVGQCDSFPRGHVEEFIEYVMRSTSTEARWRPGSALSLWEACAELDGFAAFLEASLWQGLAPDGAFEAIHLFHELVLHDISPARRQVKWRVLCRAAPRIFEVVRGIDAGYQEKAVAYLRDLAWTWDEPDKLAQHLDRYLALLPRLCRQPFARQVAPGALASLTALGPREWAALTSADDESFRKLEQETRRKNDARLVERGLETLAESAASWTVAAFQRCPAHLVRSAKVLGCVGAAARQGLVRSWLRHPLLTLDAEDMAAEHLVREIERHRRADVHNPVPRAFHRAIESGKALRPGQLQRVLCKVRADLVVTRVDLLRRLALDSLARAVGPVPETPEARHAVCLQGFIRDNRRALRRFLRAYFAGQRTYRTDHPANRDWLALHPRLAGVWLRGLQRTVTGPGGRHYRLAIESDPLEILRLGTHVGTCLGIGGMLADSAAAVALDINKQVVYARDASGRVVARQLLALSDDERLVCFHVYPRTVSTAIRQCFREYDRELATALGIAIHEPGSNNDGYQIAHPVSSYWWDDEAWDGKIDQDPETPHPSGA